MVNIWFEPHSTTIDNEDSRASGWSDIDLSQKGIEQSLDLVKRSRTRGLVAIFCSNLQRAYKTAVPTATELGIPIFTDERLRECNYGDFTLQPSEVVEKEKLKRINEPFPNGESYEQCMDRMQDFLNRLRVDFNNKTVMIIGHKATHYGLDHHINGVPLQNCITQKWEWQPGWQYTLQ